MRNLLGRPLFRLLALSAVATSAPAQDVPIVLHALELEDGHMAAALSFRSGRRFEPDDRPGLVDALVTAWNARAATAAETGGLQPDDHVTIRATDERIVLSFRTTEERLVPLVGRLVARLAQPDYTDHATIAASARSPERARVDRVLRWLTSGHLPSAKDERPISSNDLLAFHQSAIGRLRARLDVLGSPAEPELFESQLAAELAALPLGAPQPRTSPPPEFPTIERTRIVVAPATGSPRFALTAAWTEEATPMVRAFVAHVFASDATATAEEPGPLGRGTVRLVRDERSWQLHGSATTPELAASLESLLTAFAAPADRARELASLRDEFVAGKRRAAEAPEYAWQARLAAILEATPPTARSEDLERLAGLTPDALAALVGRVLEPARILVVVSGPAEVTPDLSALAATTVLPERGARGDGLHAVVELETTLERLGGRELWAAMEGYSEASQVTLRGLDQPVVTRIFRRFEPFAVRIEQESTQGPVVTIARPDAGWTIVGDQVAPLSNDQRRTVLTNAQGSLAYWLHRIASESDLRVRYVDDDERRLEVYARDRFHTRAWFVLAPDGRPERFGIGVPSTPEAQLFELSEWTTIEGYAFPSIRRNQGRGMTTQSAFGPNTPMDAALFEPRVSEPR